MTTTEKQNSDLLNEARYIANNIDGGSVDYAVEKILAFALKTSAEQNEQLLEALTGCREMLNQFVEHFEEKFDLSDDTTEELLEAFDEGGGYGRNDENFRLTAQGRKYRDLADAAISAAKGEP